MIVYRGFKDTLPSKINFDLVFDGLYGTGVYFSKDIATAKWYGFKACDVFGIVAGFNIGDRSLLKFKEGVHFKDYHPTDSHFNLLSRGKLAYSTRAAKVPQSELLSAAISSGYEGIELEMNFQCERMVVLPSYAGTTIESWLFYDLETTTENLPEKEMLVSIEKIKASIGY